MRWKIRHNYFSRARKAKSIDYFSFNYVDFSEDIHFMDDLSCSLGLPNDSTLLSLQKEKDEDLSIGKGGMLIIVLHLMGIGFFLWIALQAWIEMYGVP